MANKLQKAMVIDIRKEDDDHWIELEELNVALSHGWKVAHLLPLSGGVGRFVVLAVLKGEAAGSAP